MGGPRAEPPEPRMLLLSLLWLLVRGIHTHHGRPGLVQCFGVPPRGDLNCSWESGGLGEVPSELHLQSQKYHSNRSWEVLVPPGQSWVTVPREQLTNSDHLLVWGTREGHLLWPPTSVNLETRMKPDPPLLDPEVDFLEEEGLEAIIHWILPSRLHLDSLICQFYYRGCRDTAWTVVELLSLTPLEIRDLELGTSYEVQGRCRPETEKDLWGRLSATLSFQTPPSAPKDLWLSGRVCDPPGGPDPLLLWKIPSSCVQGNYTVWFQLENETLAQEGTPCCHTPIPKGAKAAWVSATNSTSRDPFTNLSLVCLGPGSAPQNLEFHRIQGGRELWVSWSLGPGEPQEHVMDWAPEDHRLEELSWVRLPKGTLRAALQGNFSSGVPYRVTVSTVFPQGLAPSPPLWVFTEELVPLMGPKLHRLQDAPTGSPVIAWDEVPRALLRGHLTHYTLCVGSRVGPPHCKNVSSSAQNFTLPDLHWGPCELWMRASTVAGLGPRGPSLRFHLPDNTQRWKVLLGVLTLWCLLLLGCVLCLLANRRCPHLQHKMLPRWVWERAPDPANSHLDQSHMENILQAQPPGDLPFLEVEEVEPVPVPDIQPPQTSSGPLDSGYEKHFLPTPEELGLLGPSDPNWAPGSDLKP